LFGVEPSATDDEQDRLPEKVIGKAVRGAAWAFRARLEECPAPADWVVARSALPRLSLACEVFERTPSGTRTASNGLKVP